MDDSPVVVDTNIVFAALLRRESRLRETLLADTGHTFFSPRFVVVEIFKHKERMVPATALEEDELLDGLNALLARIRFLDEGIIPLGTWMEGRRLGAGVDVKDVPFVTLALHLGGRLWSSDVQLETGLRARGFDRIFTP